MAIAPSLWAFPRASSPRPSNPRWPPAASDRPPPVRAPAIPRISRFLGASCLKQRRVIAFSLAAKPGVTGFRAGCMPSRWPLPRCCSSDLSIAHLSKGSYAHPKRGLEQDEKGHLKARVTCSAVLLRWFTADLAITKHPPSLRKAFPNYQPQELPSSQRRAACAMCPHSDLGRHRSACGKSSSGWAAQRLSAATRAGPCHFMEPASPSHVSLGNLGFLTKQAL